MKFKVISYSISKEKTFNSLEAAQAAVKSYRVDEPTLLHKIEPVQDVISPKQNCSLDQFHEMMDAELDGELPHEV
jgi:hypothetical protein